MYSLILTANMNGVDPQAWLTDILACIAAPASSSAGRAALELDAGISRSSCSIGQENGSRTNKYQSRENRAHVREILLRD